jgi:hypothetical protein
VRWRRWHQRIAGWDVFFQVVAILCLFAAGAVVLIGRSCNPDGALDTVAPPLDSAGLRLDYAGEVVTEIEGSRYDALAAQLFMPCTVSQEESLADLERTTAALRRLVESLGQPQGIERAPDLSEASWYAISVGRGNEACWVGRDREIEREVVTFKASSAKHTHLLIKVLYSRTAVGWRFRGIAFGFPVGIDGARAELLRIAPYVADGVYNGPEADRLDRALPTPPASVHDL